MNSEALSALIAKNPSLKAAKAKLEAMEPGAYCIHRSWGFGQIKSYDESSQRLIIDFKGKKGHPMDPTFCLNTMEILPAKHLLVRKETEPKKIAELIAENPAQLIAEALEAYPNHATSAIDLEITLTQVVGEDKYKKWWSVAKKAVAKDPRISTPEKKTELFVLRETPVSAEDEILEQFNSTRSARRRIALAEELVATVAKKEIKTDLVAILKAVADAVKDSNQIDASERLYGASVRDDLAKLAGSDEVFEPSQAALIATVRDLPAIAEKIPFTFRASSSTSSRRPTPSSAVTSSSPSSRPRRASSRPSASTSSSRTAMPRNSPPPSSAGRPSRTCAPRSSSGSSRTATRRNSRSSSTT